MTLGQVGDFFLKRIPDRQSFVLIFGTATFLTYTWTVVVSLWNIPSWLYYLGTSQVIALYSYSFIVNFLESCSLAALMVLLGMLFPRRWWFDQIVPVSVAVLSIMVASMVWHAKLYQQPALRDGFVNSQPAWWIGTTGLIVFLSVSAIRIKPFNILLLNLADRFSIFLFLYFPLTVLSLLVIVFRAIR